MITREFNLYLHAGHSIPLVINVNQYDRGESWVFTLFNSDGTQYTPSSGAIVGIKSDNLGIINTATVDSQGRVVVAETQQMTAAVGKAVFELVIDDGTHGTANFVVLVEPKPGDNADLSESDISMIEEAVEAAANIKPYGSPLVASTVAGMTDHDKVYVYVGSETGYTSGNWYYWDGDSWESGGVYNSVAVQTDTTLTLSGVAADAKKTGDEISDLKSQIANGMPYEVKLALDNMLAHVAYNDYDSSNDYATFHAWAESINVTSISAVFTQGSEEFYLNSSLDDLKPYLVVTAYYDNGTSGTTTAYTLSGELTEGVSVITVLYGGVSTTFTVNVIGASNVTPVFSSYTTDGITTVTVLDHGIRVSNSTSKIYAWAYLPLPLKKGYTYKVSFDQTYVSGDTRVSIRDISSGDMGKALLPVEITSNANLTQYYEASGIPSDNANWSDATSPSGGVLLFNVTYATRATGNVTFDNLKVLEYLESEGE